jgi:hypothetical protein
MGDWEDILAGDVSNGIFILVNVFFTLIIGSIGLNRIEDGKNFGSVAIVFFVLSIISLIVLLSFTINDYDNDKHIVTIIVTKIIIIILICTYIFFPTIYENFIYKNEGNLPNDIDKFTNNSDSYSYSNMSINDKDIRQNDTDQFFESSRSCSGIWDSNKSSGELYRN